MFNHRAHSLKLMLWSAALCFVTSCKAESTDNGGAGASGAAAGMTATGGVGATTGGVGGTAGTTGGVGGMTGGTSGASATTGGVGGTAGVSATGGVGGMTGGIGGMTGGVGGMTGGASGMTGGSGGAAGSTDAGGDDDATFTDVFSIIQAKCGGGDFGCHVMGSSGELEMHDQASAYTNLVGVDSSECDGETRVVAGDADASLIIKALEGTACDNVDQMPRGRDPLSEDEIATIRSWIEAGALNN